MKKYLLHVKARALMLLCLCACIPFAALAKEFVLDEGLLEPKTVVKIHEMGQELFDKSGVHLLLIAKKSGDGEDIVTFEKRISSHLVSPYVLLTLFLDEKKVDIFHSSGLEKEFDKEAILSPFPWRGTIIPLLTNKKKEVGVSPALLNGYADLADKIAKHRNISLESSIGSANQTTIGIVRLLVYGFVGILIIMVLMKRMRKRDKCKK